VRCEVLPIRSGARPRVAKSILFLFTDEWVNAARGRADAEAAELIIRGVIITGATIGARRHEKRRRRERARRTF